MINSQEFSARLHEIIAYYNLSASAFADHIGVQRSSISHILSGRNKPSLDFVLKVTKRFPEVELYWLLNGKGTFPSISTSKHEEPVIKETLTSDESKDIERIIIFYRDGTFKNFIN